MIRVFRRTIVLFLTAIVPAISYLPSYAVGAAPSTVLTFDDIATPGLVIYPIPSGYGGVSWPDNVGVWSYPQGFDGNLYLPESPPNRVLFNRNHETGVAETIVSFINGPTIFDGAYFSGFNSFQFKLYNGSAL